MRKIINSKNKQYETVSTDEWTLDDEPMASSFNGITSDGVAKAIGNLGQPLQWKGPATVAQLNAGITGIQPGWTYTLTDAGTLTDGSIAVEAGDEVAWTDNGEWFKVGGDSGKIAVFKCTYSQDAHGYVYPTYEELNAARVAGKLPVIVKISPVGVCTYYVATQMSAYKNNVMFHFVDSETGAMLKLEGPTSNPVWSSGSARGPRYTTRTETMTTLQPNITVADGESVLYNVTNVNDNILINASAGTTDAQVAINSSSVFLKNVTVEVGGVSIPVLDLSLPNYDLNKEYESGILKSTYQPESSTEVPPSFDEVGLVDDVLIDADIAEKARYTNKMVVQIVGQVALLLAK